MTDSHTNSHSHNSENGMCPVAATENADSSYVLSVLQFDSIFQDLEILNDSFLGTRSVWLGPAQVLKKPCVEQKVYLDVGFALTKMQGLACC